MGLKQQITRTLFRGLRLADVPDVLEHMKFQDLRRRYYDLFWTSVAAEVGAEIQKWDDGYQRLTQNGMALILRGPELRLDDHLTLDLMGNKALTYRLMSEQGLDVPRNVRFPVTNIRKAASLLATAGRPIVVKPNFGTGGGRGVTTGIMSEAGLCRAALWAARFDTDLIAEEQIEGHSWRLLFADGKFLDAVRRDPPRIEGDGKNNIRALVKSENHRRLHAKPFTALSPIRIDRECMNYLEAQELSPGSIPAAGETIILKRAVNENMSAQNHSLRDKVHPSTIATCLRLLGNLGVRLGGIDIITHDISKPLSRDNGVIGEINTTPGLHHHDLVSTPSKGTSVAASLIAQMFETRSGVVMLPGQNRPAPQLRMAAG